MISGRTVTIKTLDRCNTTALREALPDAVASGAVVLTKTTASFAMTAKDAHSLVMAAQAEVTGRCNVNLRRPLRMLCRIAYGFDRRSGWIAIVPVTARHQDAVRAVLTPAQLGGIEFGHGSLCLPLNKADALTLLTKARDIAAAQDGANKFPANALSKLIDRIAEKPDDPNHLNR